MKQTAFIPEFVEAIPEDLQAGRLYISIRFRTASHLCACGCDSRVVTPIKPAKWKFTYDGETVSLAPSIGRWQLPCKSHYWIRNSEVVWAPPLTEKEMQAVLERDAGDVRKYYEARQEPASAKQEPAGKASIVSRLWRRLRR